MAAKFPEERIPELRAQAQALRASGVRLKDVAFALGVDDGTLYRYIPELRNSRVFKGRVVKDGASEGGDLTRFRHELETERNPDRRLVLRRLIKTEMERQ